MKYVLICCMNCYFACFCMAQGFVPESSDDCLDRFQSMLLKVHQRYAIVGSATITSIDQPGLSNNVEWFVCEYLGNSKSPRRVYSESRTLYPHAPDSNVWEKQYIFGSKLYRSYGDYLDTLKEVHSEEGEEEEKFLRRASVGCPNLFSAAVFAPSGTILRDESSKLVQVLNQHTKFAEWKVKDDIVGKFYGSNFVSEMQFSKDSGYMPTKAKSYFYTPSKTASPPEPEEYRILWHESESQWKKIDDDTWVPIHVTSILHRTSAKSNRGREVEATARWELKLENSLISDENVDRLPLEGPVADVRTKLLDNEIGKRRSRR